MNNVECLNVINKMNAFLKKNLWMDFDLIKIDLQEVVLIGRVSELGKEVIKITFIEPFMVSCSMYFTYEEGDSIFLLQGDEEVELNKKYHVETGNHIFRLIVNDNEDNFFIISKGIQVDIN